MGAAWKKLAMRCATAALLSHSLRKRKEAEQEVLLSNECRATEQYMIQPCRELYMALGE